jgi:hypothetical protein
MATTPFGTALVAGLKGKTAWKFNSTVGPIFTPRFFCCADPNDLGISEGKTPVAHFTLSPNPAGTAETVSYDGSGSYDPDGSITGYAWSFEGHTPSSGTASSGTLSYASGGTYTIQLIVTDGTGLKSAPARKELVIQEVTLDVWAATSNGLYHGIATSPVTWTSKNSGLSGDDLVVNDVKIDPHTQQDADADKVIWRATVGGVQVSADGGDNWAEKNPGTVTNQWSDGTAPTIADLEFKGLGFSGDRLFVGATWLNGSDYRSWIFYTDNPPDVRSSGTAATVTWTELGTNWEA